LVYFGFVCIDSFGFVYVCLILLLPSVWISCFIFVCVCVCVFWGGSTEFRMLDSQRTYDLRVLIGESSHEGFHPNPRPGTTQLPAAPSVKVLHLICQQISKTQQWPQAGKRSLFIQNPKNSKAKEYSIHTKPK